MVAVLQYEQVMLHIIAGLSMLDRDEVAWSCLLSPLVTSHIVFAARQGGRLTINGTKEACDYSGGCSCHLDCSRFVRNKAIEFGGGVYIAATQLNLAVDDCIFCLETTQCR